jgi:2-oxoglutarate dehydrogenase E1 component
VIDDATADPKKVERILFCSGKVYYDLLEKKEELETEEVAIIRLEQLDPLPRNQIADLQKKYENAKWIWVQEEPENMGAWSHLLRKLRQVELEVIARAPSGAPATGSGQRHRIEQAKLLDRAFADLKVTA